jgi:hypothetical protein
VPARTAVSAGSTGSLTVVIWAGYWPNNVAQKMSRDFETWQQAKA